MYLILVADRAWSALQRLVLVDDPEEELRSLSVPAAYTTRASTVNRHIVQGCLSKDGLIFDFISVEFSAIFYIIAKQITRKVS
jgi:hypothetical protein